MKDFAAIDFETANENYSSVCSVGVVIVKNGKITEKLYSLIHPEPNFYRYWNTKVHGLSAKDTCNAPIFPEAWSAIAPKIVGLPLIAHNSLFDEGCLKAVHKFYSMPYPEYKFHCTVRASRKVFPDLVNHKLPTVSTHVGYDLSQHHHALADAEACAEIAKVVFES